MQALSRPVRLFGPAWSRLASSAGLFFKEHGRAEDVLQLVSPEVGSPGEGEVLVRMLAVCLPLMPPLVPVQVHCHEPSVLHKQEKKSCRVVDRPCGFKQRDRKPS